MVLRPQHASEVVFCLPQFPQPPTQPCGKAVTPSGVVAPFAFEGSADGAAFETYVEKVLAPSLEPGNIVIWDRLSVHGSATAKAAIEAAGATVEPLPPYSPDLNPIEEMFSKLKSGLQSLAARTTEAVISGIGTVLDTMTLTDIAGWFRDRCAYAMRT